MDVCVKGRCECMQKALPLRHVPQSPGARQFVTYCLPIYAGPDPAILPTFGTTHAKGSILLPSEIYVTWVDIAWLEGMQQEGTCCEDRVT